MPAQDLTAAAAWRQNGPVLLSDGQASRTADNLMSAASVNPSSPEELSRRLAWFEEYTAQAKRPAAGFAAAACPCCGCKTLTERGQFEICAVCYWEDDGQDDGDADESRGGPNGHLSLTNARANYLRFGACEESMLENVRPPHPEELPDAERS